MLYFMGLALALGLGVPIAAAGAALGQGRAAASGLESMARQPESSGDIRTAMILSFAFMESLVIFSLLVFFLMYIKMPTQEQIVSVAGAQAGTSTNRGQ